MFAYEQMAPRPIPHSVDNTSIPPQPSSCQMRSLQQMYDPNTSDKQGAHSYLQLYQHLFAAKRIRARTVVEIGIDEGGSIILWHEYFLNALVWGLDIMPRFPHTAVNRLNLSHVRLIYDQSAYDDSFVKRTFVDTNTTLDVFIDDGPHSLLSMKEAIRLYLPLLASDGIFVIEDVKNQSWLQVLRQDTPVEDQKYIEMMDMSPSSNWPDDMTFVINREIY
jgi:hypothetical protein